MTTVKCLHNPAPELLPKRDIAARVEHLRTWPRDIADSWIDPRCGCGAPDSVCEWDDLDFLEGLL